jgi:hypothetical protein
VARYSARLAMAAVAAESVSDREIPDFDALSAAVETLSAAARRETRFSREWWLEEYWLAYGLLLQRDYESASLLLQNMAVGGYVDEAGSEALIGGERVEEMFEELNKRLSAAQR